MRALKVLQLELWMIHGKHPISSNYTPIKPILGRDGYYLRRSGTKYLDEELCWFEVAGEAYKIRDSRDFKYCLSLGNHRPLSAAEVSALLAVKRQRLISKEQRKLLYLDQCWKVIREVRRGVPEYRPHYE